MNVKKNWSVILCGCTVVVGFNTFYKHYGCDYAAHRRITHLWQHLVLPSPAQSYSQQVVHHRGRLQADDTIVVVFRNSAQDCVTVSLKHTNTDVDVEMVSWGSSASDRGVKCFPESICVSPWTHWWAAAAKLLLCSPEGKTDWERGKCTESERLELDNDERKEKGEKLTKK